MSRIGKKPIQIPEKTEVSVGDGFVVVKGPLGELTRTLAPEVRVSVENGEVRLMPNDASLKAQALWGTFASHITNMVVGVNKKYEKKLVIEGVGYRVEQAGSKLTFSLGYSHPIVHELSAGLEATAEKGSLTITGIDKEAVGQCAAEIRALRKPEPYKGKGIRYHDEIIRRKQGKKTA